MRKLYLFILSMLAFGLARAQNSGTDCIPDELCGTSLETAPNVYIKNTRSRMYVCASEDDAGAFSQKNKTPHVRKLFRFVRTGTNMYRIFSVGNGNYVNDPTKGTYASHSDVTVWHTMSESGSDNRISIRNSEATTGNNAWNDDATRSAVTYWTHNDAGSSWIIEKEDMAVNASVRTCKPSRRLAALAANTEVMIFNTCINGTERRTGFLQPQNGNLKNHYYWNVRGTLQSFEGTDNNVFVLETGSSEGKWYLKHKKTGKYVGANGTVNNDSGVDLTITEFSGSGKKAGVNSLNDDGTVTAKDNITAANHVWLIKCDSEEGGKVWNGNPNQFAIWSTGHPFAFFSVSEVESTLCTQVDGFLTATKTRLETMQNMVGGPLPGTMTALATACDVDDKTTDAFFNQALQALETAGQADVKQIEEGKAYVIVSVANPRRSEAAAYLKVDDSGNTITLQTGDYSSCTNDAKFVVRRLSDGKCVLANGRYNHTLQFTGGSDRTLTEGYDAQFSPIKVVPMNRSRAEVKLLARRSETNPSTALIVNKQNQTFDKIGGEDWTGSQQFSIRFKLVETGYPATATLHESSGISGVTSMATWSAPYATVCPEGVTAYYASENGETVRMARVEGAIPANQGVVLVGTDTGATVMKPAAGEQTATITNNLLGNTAGQEATINNDCFVLSRKNGLTAFYMLSDYATMLPANRAYLTAGTGGGESRQLVFGFDDVTGVPILQDAAQQHRPTYDLSGRAVSAKRQGLYIRGGKKFIVK